MEQVAQPRQTATGTLALATLVLGAIVFGIEAPHVLPLARVRALGLTDRQTLWLVRGPKAMRLSLAPMTNDFVALLKDSSLVSVITVVELTKQTSIFAANVGSWVVPGALCAALYLVMSLPLAAVARRLERHWSPR